MKTTASRLVLAGVLLVPTTLLISPQVAAALRQDENTKTYTLERTFKKDTTDRYNVTLKTKVNNPQLGGEIDLNMDMTVKETTKEIKDGVATIHSEFERAQASFGGIEQDLTTAFPKSIYKTDKTGRVWNVKTEGGDPTLQGEGGNERMIAVVRSGFYPPQAVKVGDAWDVTVIERDKKDKDDKEIVLAKGKAKAVAIEKVGEFTALKIKSKIDLTLDGKVKPPPVFDGEGFLDTTSGKILKMTGIVEGTLGQLGNTKANISLSLLSGEDKKPKTDAKKDEAKPADKKKDG
jgi:hypothetical protein